MSGASPWSRDRAAPLCVLGSISITVDGQAIPIGGEKPRRLLAMLILHRNSVVSAERLMDVLWGDEVPPTGAATLQSYVSRLRRVLPTSVRLLGEPPGYRLAAEPGSTDVDRFDAALASGFEHVERSPTIALEHLDDALAQWRGDAFVEFADEWWARADAARLAEQRLHVREARLSALLALGLDEAAASDAEAITVDHPWRERPWRSMLLALYRMGRQGEALRRAKQYRTGLRDDLGLDPSPEFVALERDVATGAIELRAAPPPVDPVVTVDPVDRVVTATPRPDPTRLPHLDADHLDAAHLDAGHLDDGVMPLIGRDDDLARVVDLCGQRRLVTLLGPGGIGKTQLALRAASTLASSGRLRSELVELAPVRNEHSVIAAVATQLQVQPQQGRSVTESVLDLLGNRPLLLVLDNCEHVLDTIARFAERLLRVCPAVHILATSREPLALPAETVFKVPALPVAEEGSDVDHHASSPAVALFLQRARAANSDVVVDEATTRAVAELCRRLDGVPLAIELAAARSRSLTPTEITERLGDRFTLLDGSSRATDHRHRSLRDLVDWSYRLLDAAEQQLFRRLSIFAGSFDLDAVERVCGYGQVPSQSVAPVLAGLVNKSMVQASAGNRTTYRLLETLREYSGVLSDAEGPQLARRHGAWILDICERAESGLHGVDERWWLDTLDGLFDDLRLAVRNALDVGDLPTAPRIVVSAREHAFRRLRYELIGWAETALERDEAERQPLAAAALGIVAYGRFVRGEIDAAIELGERSVDLARSQGTDGLGMADRALGNAYVFRGDRRRFTDALERLIDGATASGDEARIAHAYYMRSLSETRTAGTVPGMMYAERATVAATKCDNPTARAQAAYATGIWLATSEPERAREHLQRSESLARDVGNVWFELFARTETLWLHALEGAPRDALAAFADVISSWHRAGDWANQWLSLRHVLGICHLLGADELAAVIHGALDRAGAVDAFPFEPHAAANVGNLVVELRRRLGDERFTGAEQQGRTASTSVLIDLIVSQLRAVHPAP